MANDDESRGENGRFGTQYPLDAFEAAVRDAPNHVTTSKVAEAVGCSHELAYKRLSQLADEGVLTSSLVGQSRVWEVADGS
jgi:predicted HTH transcriptional regulator